MLRIKPKREKNRIKSCDAFRILIQGAVQGIGFRPFIYGLAQRMSLKGWVANTSEGVVIEVEGDKEKIYDLVSRIYEEKPPQAEIENVCVEEIEYGGYEGFEIRESRIEFEKKVLLHPDIATCPNCLEELFNPKDRRYLYPFINCTQCGPRFTIITDIPYDRDKTTMQVFKMCPRCEKEYHEPVSRRFHAQPNACWECGPQVELRVTNYESEVTVVGKEAIEKTAELLKQGAIVAIKSLGGYQLAGNALDDATVRKLRDRKKRILKPFALMAKSIKMVERYCQLNEKEISLLLSYRRPIVLLRKKPKIDIAEQVSPYNNYLGFMLPYTPIHYILFYYLEIPLVMTSGNITDEPIYYKDEEAFQKLKDIADYFLIHNREIYIRCDDSVTRFFLSLDGKFNKEYIIRRARGYTPSPITLDYSFKLPLLAVGGYLKNTFALAKDNHIFISHHIGDLDNLSAIQAFEEGIAHYKKIFQIEPEVIACDLHPEYYSTKYAQELSKSRGKKLIYVQHHHAHIASCMIENNLKDKVIGIAFDGTGYGLDETIWGGEILISDLANFERVGHLEYLPQPGGESAINNPWQMAVSWLYKVFNDEIFNLDIEFIPRIGHENIKNVVNLIKNKVNSPQTSSFGRLFASVSSILGLCDRASFEAEAEMKLEQVVDEHSKDCYEFSLKEENREFIILAVPVIREIVDDLMQAVSKERVSSKFHNGIVEIIYKLLQRLKRRYKINNVCLSGGVFQNLILLTKLYDFLTKKGFKLYIQGKVPANDGGISLGQAVIANENLNS